MGKMTIKLVGNQIIKVGMVIEMEITRIDNRLIMGTTETVLRKGKLGIETVIGETGIEILLNTDHAIAQIEVLKDLKAMVDFPMNEIELITSRGTMLTVITARIITPETIGEMMREIGQETPGIQTETMTDGLLDLPPGKETGRGANLIQIGHLTNPVKGNQRLALSKHAIIVGAPLI